MKEFLDFHLSVWETYHALPDWFIELKKSATNLPPDNSEEAYFFMLDTIIAFIAYIQKNVSTYQNPGK